MRLLCYCLFLVSAMAHAQQTTTSPNRLFDFGARVGIVRNLAFGDNAYNDGYQPVIGLGVEVDVFRYKRLRAGIGVNYSATKISDESIVGPFDKALYSSVYLQASYQYALADKWTLTPLVGIGEMYLDLNGQQFADVSQRGPEKRFGASVSYRIASNYDAYFGAYAVFGDLKVESHGGYADYYSEVHQLQFQVGFYFD